MASKRNLRHSASAPSFRTGGRTPGSPKAEFPASLSGRPQSPFSRSSTSLLVLPKVAIQVITRGGAAEARFIDGLRSYDRASTTGTLFTPVQELPLEEDDDPEDLAEEISPRERTSMMLGLTVKTGLQNNQQAQAVATLFRNQKKEKEDLRPRPQTIAEEDMESTLSDMTSQVALIQKNLQNFDPRANKGENVSTKRMLVDGMTKEERTEHFELLKFTRKIEGELPPLVRSLPGTYEKEPAVDRPVISFNCSVAALERSTPKVSRTLLAARALEQVQRVRSAIETKQQLHMDKMDRRILQVAKTMKPERPKDELAAEAEAEKIKTLLKTVCISHFLTRLRTEIKLSKMTFKERIKLVQTKELEGKMNICERVCSKIIDCIEIREGLNDPLFEKHKPRFAAIFARRVGVKRRREAARTLLVGLSAWKHFGRLTVRLFVLRRCIRRIQFWWRLCRRKLQKLLFRVSKAWLKVEQEDILNQFRLEDHAVKMSSHGRNRALDIDKRMSRRMIEDEVRMTFLVHELRGRRFNVLPLIEEFQESCRQWKDHISKEAESKKEAAQLFQETRPGRPISRQALNMLTSLFAQPPEKGPTYMPRHEDLVDMLERARIDPRGWIPMPLPPGQTKSRQQSKAKKTSRRSRQGSKMLEDPTSGDEAGRLSKDSSSSRGRASSKEAPTSRKGTRRRAHVMPAMSQQDLAEKLQDAGPVDDSSDSSDSDDEVDKVDLELGEELNMRPGLMPGGMVKPVRPLQKRGPHMMP